MRSKAFVLGFTSYKGRKHMATKVPSKLKAWFYLRSIQHRIYFFGVSECYRCFLGFCLLDVICWLLTLRTIRIANSSTPYKRRANKILEGVKLLNAKSSFIYSHFTFCLKFIVVQDLNECPHTMDSEKKI